MKSICLFFLFTIASYSQSGEGTEGGTPYSADGRTVRSFDFAGIEKLLHKTNDTIYVVNFWATWCAPCIKELPHFDRINSEYKNRKVKVILVSLDMKKQIESNLIPFIKRKKIESQVVHLYAPDANEWIGKVSESWSGALPATIIYSADERQFYEQGFTYEDLENEIKTFLE